MNESIKKLYEELEFLLNHAPVEDDCTSEENEMYADMANLKESIFYAVIDKYDNKEHKLKRFHVRYRETYEGFYDVLAANSTEAEKEVQKRIQNGSLDGPDQCCDSSVCVMAQEA